MPELDADGTAVQSGAPLVHARCRSTSVRRAVAAVGRPVPGRDSRLRAGARALPARTARARWRSMAPSDSPASRSPSAASSSDSSSSARPDRRARPDTDDAATLWSPARNRTGPSPCHKAPVTTTTATERPAAQSNGQLEPARPALARRAASEALAAFALVFAGCGAIVANAQYAGSLGAVGVSLVFGQSSW